MFLPESPRFLVDKDRNEQASRVLAQMHGKEENDADVLEELHDIQHAVQYERTLGQTSWKEMMTTYKRRSLIAVLVQALGQLGGINIVTVSWTILAQVSYETNISM